MIIDAASGFSRYEPLHKLFPDVARFLARPDLVALPDGRHEIAGEDLFAIVMRANGKSADAAQLEIHDRYMGTGGSGTGGSSLALTHGDIIL